MGAATNNRGSAPPPQWISSASPRWRPGPIRNPFFPASKRLPDSADGHSSHLLPATSQPPPIASKITPLRTPPAPAAASAATFPPSSTPPSTATKAPQPPRNPEPANSNPPPTNQETRPPAAPPWDSTNPPREPQSTTSTVPCNHRGQGDDNFPHAAPAGAAATPTSSRACWTRRTPTALPPPSRTKPPANSPSSSTP